MTASAYPLTLNTTQLATAAGANMFQGSGGDLWLTLKDDSVAYKRSATGPVTTKAITQIAPNGVIAIDKGTLYVQGELNTRLTVASLRSSGSTGGNVIVSKTTLRTRRTPASIRSARPCLACVGYGSVNIDTTAAHNNFTVQGFHVLPD
jgi:hypothetical protein